MEMAQKILAIDADDPEALVGVAQVLAERTRDTDLDRDQRLAEARKDAERALTTVDTDIPTSGYPPEQLAAYKGFLRSEAYAVLGKLSISTPRTGRRRRRICGSRLTRFRSRWIRSRCCGLAVALDMQNKNPEALKYADQAVELTKERPTRAPAKRHAMKRIG